jgi:hypothetical protein
MAQWRQKMSDSEARELQVLMLAAEENYAHARDHESLRAQVTATLVAAAFVLIGLAIDKGVVGPKLVFVAGSAVLIGILNLMIVRIHNNRFDFHVSIARNARQRIAEVKIESDIPKKMSLSAAWQVVAALPIAAGIGLLLVG